MNIGELFNTIFLEPIVNLLVFIYQLLNMLHLPGAFGFSIILLTIIIRLIVWPFMSSQLKAAKKMAELKPEMDKLKAQHKNDKQAFAAAQMALYKEKGINPAGGCLPAIIQIPIIWALFNTISTFFNSPNGWENINQMLYFPSLHLNSAPELNFFGLNLATKPGEFTSAGFGLLLIPLFTALFQLIQSKMMTPKPVKIYPEDKPKEKKEKEDMDESLMAVQSQMMYFMPLMVGYFAFNFPVGLALYWNTFTLLGIVQQYMISGWGGLENWLKKAHLLNSL